MLMKSSKSELINYWKQFSAENSKPVKEIDFNLVDRVARFFSPSIYYYYIFNFTTLRMEFVSDSYQSMTGLDRANFSLNRWLESIHPDEIDFVHQCEQVAGKFLFEFIPLDQIPRYKVSYTYKMRGPDDTYFQSLHQAIALSMTDNDTIGHVLGIETKIDQISKYPSKRISFLDLEGQENYLNIDVAHPTFDKINELPYGFTPQEMKIIELISLGHSSTEIAKMLFVSDHTIRTHRANILSKSPARNMTSLVADLFRQGYL